MLINAERRIFVGQRLDSLADAWQMPQGGIDPGEEPQAAALRELTEETGIAPHLVEIIARSSQKYLYDLPPELMGKMWGGAYRGQAQHWFAMRFLGSDADVNIATHTQEFRAWQWATPDTLVDRIVPFKKELYAHVLSEFAAHL
jgi:putative (di)nucleoside polyphosphate hydrolase